MKIQCDVCEKKEASVFCAADEAALCEGCDHKVHHANKLATKHQRFSLLHPSFKDAPLCDICQAKRAFLFCKEDRAILCRECDNTIHKANEHTQSHHRFLLTGVRISASSTSYPINNNNNSSTLSISSSQPNSINSNSVSNNHSYYSNNYPTKITTSTSSYSQFNEDNSISTNNSMPQYFMDSMPGWRLEDLLDSSYDSHCKTFDNTKIRNQKQQVEEESMCSYSSTEEYSRMWEFNQQGPLVVPSHLSPIFFDRL